MAQHFSGCDCNRSGYRIRRIPVSYCLAGELSYSFRDERIPCYRCRYDEWCTWRNRQMRTVIAISKGG